MNGFFLGMIEITAGMSFLILVMLFGLKLIGGKFTAKCRYILWTLVMIRLAIPFSFGILPALIEVPVEPEPVQMQMQVPTVEYTPVPQNPVTIPPQEQVQMPNPPVQSPIFTEPDPEPITWDDVKAYIPHAYLTGAALFLLWNLLSYRVYTAKILRTAKEANAGTQKIYEAVCRKKGLTRPPVLLVSPDVNSPAAFGLLRRRIVLPEIDFTENGLAGTLSHEVTHCRRGDLWIKAVCLLARAFHWCNPLVHLAAFRCEMEMELSCDESVLAGCDENTRAAYGEVMLDIIKRCRRNRGALTTHFNPGKNAVKARFTNILYGSGKKRGLWLIAVCLVLCLIAGAIFGKPKLTLDNIQEQNGFTILSQETRELTLTLPMKLLPAYDEIASAENAHLELDAIPVFTTDTTEVFLHTTGVSGHSPEGVEKDVLYLGFDIRHTLTESGTIYTGTRVMNESGEHSYTSAFHVTQDTLQEYNRGIRWMGRGPSDQFHLYVDAALYTALQGDVEIGITLNEIVYARGNEVKIYGRENSESTADDSGAEQTGEFPTIEAYVTYRMAKETTAKYFAAGPDGTSISSQQKTANVTDTKLTVLEKKGELAGLAPEGVLECWRYKYLLKLDVPAEEVIPVGGQDREDDWFDLEGQNGHTVVALRHTDGTYTILMDEMTGDGLDFTGYRNSYEEAIYDWYVKEYALGFPLYVEEWGDLIVPPEGERTGNTPVHRYDGDGWGIYIPVQAWYQSTDAMENQWLWRSSYNTGSTLMVDIFSHSLEDEYVTAEKQGYTPADSTKRVWENHTDGLHSCYYYYENPNGGFWRVTIEWTDEGVTNDNANIVIEPQILRLMAEKFVVFGAANNADNAVTVTSAIYLCDDVYRGDTTPTHGESTITFPAGLNGYKLYTCEVLLCGDECDPHDVVYRNYFGYAGGFPLTELEITKTGSYPARLWLFTYPDEILEQILSDMDKGGATEEQKQEYRNKRAYLYHLTIDEEHCACIFIEPEDMNIRPENEQEILDALVASVEIDITPTDTMRMSNLNRHLVYPARWYHEQIGLLGTASGDGLPGADLMFWLDEYRAYVDSGNGRVWTLEAVPLADFEKTAEHFRSTEGVDVYTTGYGSNRSLLGTDSKHAWVLVLPTDVQFLENDSDSRKNYELLQKESQTVLEYFMNQNGITPNPTCPASVVYTPRNRTVSVPENPDTIWQTFLDTVVAPYEENISSKEFLDLDGNGIEELLLFDLGNGICEIYTIEGGDVRCLYTGQQGNGHSLLTIYHDNPAMLAPPSLGAGEYVFYASRTPEDVSKTRYKNWFIPSPKIGGYVLYSTYGHTTSRTDQYFHFYSGEDAVLGKVLCVAELSRFEREAINSNPALGWECRHQGEKVSKNQYMTAVQECWDMLEQRYGVTYTEEETLHRFDELRKTPDTSFELLADLLDTLKTENPQVYMSRTPYGEADSDVLHQAWGFSDAADCAWSLAVNYTFEPLTAMEVQETTRITLHSPTEGEWKIHGWVNSNYITLVAGGQSYFFRAVHKTNSEICFGTTLQNWFDDAEYAAMPYEAVIPDTDQGFLAAAQTFVESWYGRNLQVSSGSENAFSYVSCSVRDAENREGLIGRGWIGQNTYTYYITVVFVPENTKAEMYHMAGNTGPYSGEDPAVPAGAYEFQRCGYITLEEDGWHGEVGGTGW